MDDWQSAPSSNIIVIIVVVTLVVIGLIILFVAIFNSNNTPSSTQDQDDDDPFISGVPNNAPPSQISNQGTEANLDKLFAQEFIKSGQNDLPKEPDNVSIIVVNDNPEIIKQPDLIDISAESDLKLSELSEPSEKDRSQDSLLNSLQQSKVIVANSEGSSKISDISEEPKNKNMKLLSRDLIYSMNKHGDKYASDDSRESSEECSSCDDKHPKNPKMMPLSSLAPSMSNYKSNNMSFRSEIGKHDETSGMSMDSSVTNPGSLSSDFSNDSKKS